MKFKIEDQYEYNTDHIVSCEAEFGDNSKTTLEIQKCFSNTYMHVVDDPAFVSNISSENFQFENCTRYQTVSYSFDFYNITNGTLLRCFAMDYNIQVNKTTECRPLMLNSLPGKFWSFFILVNGEYHCLISTDTIEYLTCNCIFL